MNDVASERVILAALFQKGYDCYIEICDIVDENSFSSDETSAIYKCLVKIVNEKDSKADIPSIIAVANSLKIQQFFQKDDQAKYLRSLTLLPVEIVNAKKAAAKLKKMQIAKTLAYNLSNCANELLGMTGDEPISQIVSLAEATVLDQTFKISNAEDPTPKEISEGLDEYVKFLEDNPISQLGISSGFKVYDRAIGGGLRPGTVNLIGARMKTGKSFFADNVAMNVAKQGIPVLMFDTEMTAKDHWHRLLACIGNIKIEEIENGSFSKDSSKKTRVHDASKALKDMPFKYKSIAGKSFDEVLSLARRWVIKDVGLDDFGKAKPCLIVLDYIKLMDDGTISKNIAEYQALGFLMTSLHNFMVQYGVACLAFTQLNRDGITREDTDVASGSDRILWLCSNFSIYKRKTEEEMADESVSQNNVSYNLKLIPVVARHGKGIDAGDYINISANYEYGRITEGPTRNEFHQLRSTRINNGFQIEELPDEISATN
jgi:replicative DNA helicase